MAIRLEEILVTYRDPHGQERTALDVGALDIASGAQICLTGGSGSGKTTLLNCLAGIVVPSRGRVFVGDRDITKLSEPERDRFRARHIGYVFQTFNLLRGLTCLENVALPAMFAGASGAQGRQRATVLLERVGLGERLQARATRLSVGEQQRVAIARSLINRPDVVLADEPTANLDEEASDAVLGLLTEVADEEQSTLVLVTHESRVRNRFETVVSVAGLRT